MIIGDVTISFRVKDGHTLPTSVLRLIALYAGPLIPDPKSGVVTMVISISRWQEIQAEIEKGKL